MGSEIDIWKKLTSMDEKITEIQTDVAVIKERLHYIERAAEQANTKASEARDKSIKNGITGGGVVSIIAALIAFLAKIMGVL